MKLWILRPIEEWTPWYDKSMGFVVRAATERRARIVASTQAGDEGEKSWLDRDLTSCKELHEDGPEEVVIQDFAAA